MPWYRIARGDLDVELRDRLFDHLPGNQRPNQIAIETSEFSLAPSYLVTVLYRNIDDEDEINDWQHDSVAEALEWCRVDLQVPDGTISIFDAPLKIRN